VDVAIRFGGGPWPPLVCEKFMDDEYFPVASPRLYRGKLPRTPKELAKARIIREDRDLWVQWFKAAGVPLEGPILGPSFNDSTFALQAAARGEGIALARLSIIGEDLERGALKRLFDIPLPSPTSYWFVSPKETAAMAKVKLFRDWVRAELAAGPTRKLLR
jgi:LysR family glycine cleavage system transcriptional activator